MLGRFGQLVENGATDPVEAMNEAFKTAAMK